MGRAIRRPATGFVVSQSSTRQRLTIIHNQSQTMGPRGGRRGKFLQLERTTRCAFPHVNETGICSAESSVGSILPRLTASRLQCVEAVRCSKDCRRDRYSRVSSDTMQYDEGVKEGKPSIREERCVSRPARLKHSVPTEVQ